MADGGPMDDRPVFNQFDLAVGDMDAAIAFYRLLGVEIDEPWRTASGAHHADAHFPNGNAFHLDSRAFIAVYNEGWPAAMTPGRAGVIGFQVRERETVDEIHATITAAGYESRQAPFDAFWGCRYMVVADPDGNDVGVMSARDVSRITPPPDM
jgi:uncharacterized glyoxalase superfamily protein PhnB